MARVSVVIPSYNRADLIEATIRSVLAQSHAPHEVIIVDDGSTDNTEAVCARFPAPVRYVRQANTGLPGARNRGIRESTGDWVAFCDSDDLWDPQKLELQLAALAAVPEARWSITGLDLVDPDGNLVSMGESGFEHAFPVFRHRGVRPQQHFSAYLQTRRFWAGGERLGYFGDAYEMLFDGNVALPSSSLVARSLIEEAGPFDADFRWAEDTEFFHRMSAYSPVALLPDPLVHYRVGHPSMISTGDRSPFIRNAIVSLERAAGLRPQLTPSQQRAYRLGKRTLRLRLAYSRLSVLDGAGVRAALADAWREDPHLSVRLLSLTCASLLPDPALRGLHWAKRRVKRAAR